MLVSKQDLTDVANKYVFLASRGENAWEISRCLMIILHVTLQDCCCVHSMDLLQKDECNIHCFILKFVKGGGKLESAGGRGIPLRFCMLHP